MVTWVKWIKRFCIVCSRIFLVIPYKLLIHHDGQDMDVFGFTDLHKAIILGNKSVISRLIANNFDKEIKDENGFTASELAILLEKEFLIPYIDGSKPVEDEVTRGNETDVIEGFQGRLLIRKKLREKYFNLKQSKEKPRINENKDHTLVYQKCVKFSNNYLEEGFSGKILTPTDDAISNILTPTYDKENTSKICGEKVGNNDWYSDSGFSTLRSVDDFSDVGESFYDDIDDDDVFINLRDGLFSTQQWIGNKGLSYNDLNAINIHLTDSSIGRDFTESNIVKRSIESKTSALLTIHGHITSINKPQVDELSSDSCLEDNTRYKDQQNRFFYKYCESIHRRDKLKRSFSWPDCKNFLNSHKKMEDWEVWDFGEKETKQEDDEEGSGGDVKEQSSTYGDDETFERSLDDSKGFSASYKLDDSIGNGNQYLHVLSNEQKTRSISESHGFKRDSREDLRRFNSSCALDQAGKEDKYVFTIQNLSKARSSSELVKTSDHNDDARGFSKSFQYEPKKEKKGKSFLSFFSKLKRSTSSGELRPSRSRKSSASSDDGRGFNNSITIDKSSGEEKHVLIVPKMSRSQSSTSVTESVSMEDNDDVRGFTSSLNMEVMRSKPNKAGVRKTSLGENQGRSLRPDSGYYSLDDHPKKDISYSITFTPEESNTKQNSNSPSKKTMTSLQQGLLPILVGVGLGEEGSTHDVVTDALHPHTVQEHGVFALGSPQKSNNHTENGSTTSKVSTPTESFKTDETFSFPNGDPKHSTPIKTIELNDQKMNCQQTSLPGDHTAATCDKPDDDDISLNGSAYKTLIPDNEQTPKTNSDSDHSSNQSEINNIKQVDCEVSPLEDSMASFELHEAEYEVGQSPGYTASSFSFNGHRLEDVIEELKEDEDCTGDDSTERKITMELLKYMPPIIEQSTEEEKDDNGTYKTIKDKDEQADVVQRVLSTENLRLHDQEIDEGKTKDEILNEFVNIVITDTDQSNAVHTDIVDDKLEDNQTSDFKTDANVEEENTLKSSDGEFAKAVQDKTLEQSSQVHTEQSNHINEEINKDEPEDCDADMNRLSHDTFSVEFHVPVESTERIQTDFEVNNNGQNTPPLSKQNVKKCLWYDYSLDAAPTVNNEVAGSFNKHEKNRKKKLTRDPSLAWDGLVDVYDENAEDEEEKLDVVVDFDDREVLRQVLTDGDIEPKLDNFEIEAEYAENTEAYDSGRKLSNNSYLRLTPDGILSDDSDAEVDDQANTDDIGDLMALVQNLDAHYRKISSDKINEEVNTDTPAPTISRHVTDSCIMSRIENISCGSIFINKTPYTTHTSIKQHKVAVEESPIKERILQGFSYDDNLQNALQNSDDDHETLALSKRIYKKRERLRAQQKVEITADIDDDSNKKQNRQKIQSQQTEDFTEISDDEIRKSSKLRMAMGQKSESFTIISDNEEPHENETSPSEFNLRGVFSDSAISSGNVVINSKEESSIEFKENSDSKEQQYNEREDADSGMDLQSDDLDQSLSNEPLPKQQEKIKYNGWLEQIKPTLQDSYRVALLYLRLAKNYFGDDGEYDMQQVIMGKLAYWLIVDDDLCNFSSVISYLLSYMGVLKAENDFKMDVKMDVLLNFLSEFVCESKMLSNHIEMLTCLLSRPCSQLMQFHDMRLCLLKSCFKEEIRQVQNNGTLEYLTTCFKKISEYFVQIDQNLAEKMLEEYLLPYNFNCHSEGFVTSILKYMKLMDCSEPVKRTEDASSSLQLLNILYLKLNMTPESITLLCTYLQRPNMKLKLIEKEKEILLSTLQKHLVF